MQRIYYYKHYTNELLKAIKLDGVPVRGYYAWSLLDNFEWSDGYSEKFGLTKVDFNDPSRKRTPKKSFNYFKKLIQQNGFSETDSPCWQMFCLHLLLINWKFYLSDWLSWQGFCSKNIFRMFHSKTVFWWITLCVDL